MSTSSEELRDEVRILGAKRVPVLVFLSVPVGMQVMSNVLWDFLARTAAQ